MYHRETLLYSIVEGLIYCSKRVFASPLGFLPTGIREKRKKKFCEGEDACMSSCPEMSFWAQKKKNSLNRVYYVFPLNVSIWVSKNP
jgi:hypothetical protein